MCQYPNNEAHNPKDSCSKNEYRTLFRSSLPTNHQWQPHTHLQMLGLFVQYLTTPTLFEAVVLDEQHKIKTSYPMGLEIDMNKKEK